MPPELEFVVTYIDIDRIEVCNVVLQDSGNSTNDSTSPAMTLGLMGVVCCQGRCSDLISPLLWPGVLLVPWERVRGRSLLANIHMYMYMHIYTCTYMHNDTT